MPIDPEDVGRTYEAVIRINSQSGKGGVAYLLEKDHGLSLPRRLQIDFSKVIQEITDDSGKEIEIEEIWKEFRKNYIDVGTSLKYLSHNISSENSSKKTNSDVLKLNVNFKGKEIEINGEGNGPIEACINALSELLHSPIKISDYHQHAISSGADASAAAYIEISIEGKTFWGIGINSNTVAASFEAIISGINKSID